MKKNISICKKLCIFVGGYNKRIMYLNLDPTNSPIKNEVDSIIKTFESGNIPLLQNQLYSLYCKFNKPGGGRLITQYKEKDRLCEFFCLCLRYDWLHDNDIREVWAENAFYCIAEYFKDITNLQDQIAAALDLFFLCSYGRNDLLTKFNSILSKSYVHPLYYSFFSLEEYNGGGEYLVREFSFFCTTILSPIVKKYPQLISSANMSYFESSKKDFEFASIPYEDIIKKMTFIHDVIESILKDM